MDRKAAILRGINVGGKRKLLMADLKALCEELGWENLETYIQSGNLFFNAPGNNSELEKLLEKAIRERFGFEVPVIIRTALELETSIKNNPFFNSKSDIQQLHLTFLKELPASENVLKIKTFNAEPDRFDVVDKDVFLLCEGKYHESKLSNNFFENKLKTGATTRNWKTVLKLSDLCKK